MSLILTILKNVWPVLRINNRTPSDRETFIRDRNSAPLLDRNGEVITNR